MLVLALSTSHMQAQAKEGYVEEKTISLTDGDIKASVEQYVADPQSGKMAKMLVAMNIPFAAPPVGDLRFKAPKSPSPWSLSSPLNTNRFQGLVLNLCPQYSEMFKDMLTPPSRKKRQAGPEEVFWSEFVGGVGDKHPKNISEDCLHLNVWAPLNENGSIKDSVAVMVFIHGGGYTSGSANLNLHEATTLSMISGTIVVTINYRLGALGFLSAGSKYDSVSKEHHTANVGLMDQTKALEWVQNNIGKFGGDPKRVTIFGESAGSASTHLLMMSPKSKNLFQKAVLQSGVASNIWATHDNAMAAKASYQLAAKVGCSSSRADALDDEAMECLQKADAFEMAKLMDPLEDQGLYFGPTDDGDFFPSPIKDLIAESISNVDHEILFGFNADEGSQMLLFSKMFGRVKASSYLNVMSFDGFAQAVIPEAKQRFTLEKIRDHYHKDNVQGLTDLMTDHLFRCDIVNSAIKMERSGKKVFLYKFDEDLDFAQKAYPFLGASHTLELQPLFGRPYQTEAQAIYSDSERLLSAYMMNYWGNFAKNIKDGSLISASRGGMVISGAGYVDSVNKGPLDMTKCDFLACLPDIHAIGEGKPPKNLDCWKFTENSAAGNPAVIPGVVLALFMAWIVRRAQ